MTCPSLSSIYCFLIKLHGILQRWQALLLSPSQVPHWGIPNPLNMNFQVSWRIWLTFTKRRFRDDNDYNGRVSCNTKNLLEKKCKFEDDEIFKHSKNCECCPVSLLIVRSHRLSWFQVPRISFAKILNFVLIINKNQSCQKCWNCPKLPNISYFVNK